MDDPPVSFADWHFNINHRPKNVFYTPDWLEGQLPVTLPATLTLNNVYRQLNADLSFSNQYKKNSGDNIRQPQPSIDQSNGLQSLAPPHKSLPSSPTWRRTQPHMTIFEQNYKRYRERKKCKSIKPLKTCWISTTSLSLRKSRLRG